MANAGEVYAEKCAEADVAPRSEIARILDSWDSKTALRIELPGNSLELFERRLGDLDVVALVQTILHACTDHRSCAVWRSRRVECRPDPPNS